MLASFGFFLSMKIMLVVFKNGGKGVRIGTHVREASENYSEFTPSSLRRTRFKSLA